MAPPQSSTRVWASRPALLPVAIAILAAAGCTKWLAKPGKQVETAGGGPPVRTSAELHRLDATQPGAPPRSQVAPEQPQLLPSPFAVARTSFDQPVQPLPLKPFDRWSEQDAAGQALGLIGGPAVAELAAATQSPLADRRLKAAETLGRIGPAAAPAVSQLVRLLDDPEPQIRKTAIRTLGQIGPAAKDAVPALVQTLLEERSESR